MSDAYGTHSENERENERSRSEAERLMRDSAKRAAEITEQVMRDQIQRSAELCTSGLTVMRHLTEYNAKIAHNIGDIWQQFVGNSLNEMVRQTQRFSREEGEQRERERSSSQR